MICLPLGLGKLRSTCGVLTLVLAGLASDAIAITIMPFGDSITKGFHGSESLRGSYRLELEERFLSFDIDYDFVGDFSLSRNGLADPDLQAVSGYRIEQMTDEFADAVARHEPDVVLVLAGTNNHGDAPDADSFVTKYADLVQMINSNSPKSSIVFATVPKFGCCRDIPAWTEAYVEVRNTVRFPTMNRAIREISERHEFVEVVDLYSILDPDSDLTDFVHPNIFGHKKLADLFLSAILSHDRGAFGESSVDRMSAQIRSESPDSQFDLDSSGDINFADLRYLIHDLLNTRFGDSNLDGQFNNQDLLSVLQAGQYEDADPMNSTWRTGDWNADGDFDSDDLILAIQDGGYEQGRRIPASAVPEPTSLLMLMVGLIGVAICRRFCRIKPWDVTQEVVGAAVDF